MKNVYYRSACLTLILVCASFDGSGQSPSGSPDLVISQVYGGGGNTGAPYNADFIELFNRGSAPASLNGMSLQYASATGTGIFGAAGFTRLPELTLSPEQYFLVREAGAAPGSPGAALPSLPQPFYITIAATDSAGNVTTEVVETIVPHNQ